MQPADKKKRRRAVWLAVGGVMLVLALVYGLPVVKFVSDLASAGFLERPIPKHAYSGTSLDNLKALYQATQLYYESNEVMPGAATWMDDLKIYIKTNDLQKGEEMKKFVNPRLPPGNEVYGYAFNRALSGAFKEDIKDPAHTVLIFESKSTAWNASGDPATSQPDPELDGGNFAVTVDGTVAPLKDLLKK